ncbi:MAG: hypothetical protein J6C98_02525 [Oscillospiraceae bacterium]|nr:hypothetical protein [Oscillospiraceae bacterium]
MYASDYRAKAREHPSGNWGTSIGVAIVACLLGGLVCGSDFLPKLNISIQNQNISDLDDLLTIALGSSGMTIGFVSFLGFAQFIIGGVIQIGYARYLLKQYDHRQPQFSDLFSMFDWFGTGFCQAFLRSLYTFLWSLLFIIPGFIAKYRLP